jgi:hypothetical protein
VAECLEAHYRALNEPRFVVIGAYVTDCFVVALDRRLRSTISGKFENRSESDGAEFSGIVIFGIPSSARLLILATLPI